MDINTILLIIGLGAIGFIAYRILQKLEKPAEDQSLKMLQEHLFKIQEGMKAQDKTLSDNLRQQYAASAKIIKEVTDNIKGITEKMSKLESTDKQILGFAEQMRSLENILKNPKQRGILGEVILENTLSNVLPPDLFKMQYSFEMKDGNKVVVDAAIFFKDKTIPVDAKFSLDNYNRVMDETDPEKKKALEKTFKEDLKLLIEQTSKYVRPEAGTTDFAFMYIPADGLFYNLLNEKVGTLNINSVNLIEFAWKKRVIMVSPMTFFAYLQTIMHGLKGLEIEETARMVQKQVAELGRHLNVYQDHYRKLGDHLSKTVGSYNSGSHEFHKIDKDVTRITEGEASIDADLPTLDRPASFEDIGDDMKLKISEPAKKKIAQDS